MAPSLVGSSVLPLQDVRAGVFYLPGPPPALIDCGMRGHHRRIARALRHAHVDPRDVTLIALTHWHIDHVGGLGPVRQLTGAQVAAHRADAPVIQGLIPPTKPDLNGEGGKFARWLLLKMYRPGLVDRLLEAGDVLPEGGGLRVIGTPGHTAGHVCYYLENEGVLFVGDALINRGGQLALPPAGFSHDVVQARRSLAALRALPFDACYFGHGEPLMGKADRQIVAFLDRLNEQAPEEGS